MEIILNIIFAGLPLLFVLVLGRNFYSRLNELPETLTLRRSRVGIVVEIIFAGVFVGVASIPIIFGVQFPLIPLLLFGGIPLSAIIDSVFQLRLKLQIDQHGISQQGKFKRWGYEWSQVSGWEYHKFRGRRQDTWRIYIIIEPGGTKIELSHDLVKYKNEGHKRVEAILRTRFGPALNESVYAVITAASR